MNCRFCTMTRKAFNKLRELAHERQERFLRKHGYGTTAKDVGTDGTADKANAAPEPTIGVHEPDAGEDVHGAGAVRKRSSGRRRKQDVDEEADEDGQGTN